MWTVAWPTICVAVYGPEANKFIQSKVHFKIKTVSEGVQDPSFHQLYSVIDHPFKKWFPSEPYKSVFVNSIRH